MFTTKEAIEKRRSIRKFKPDPIPDEYITELLNAARLAPSGGNAQPWRFKIVKEQETKSRLAHAAYDQTFIGKAPVVIVCCADIQGYLDGTASGSKGIGEMGADGGRIGKFLDNRTEQIRSIGINEIKPGLAANVALAIEHIVLRALDFGLGSCWIRLMDEQKIKEIFGWDDHIYVVALLPIGYPAECPRERKRMKLEDILIK
jgi:nitroreductase